MPAHTSRKSAPRKHRPDGKISAQRLRKIGAKLASKEDIADLRVTRVQKGDKKSREAQTAEPLKKTLTEKRLKALRKKLREMEALMSKQAAGEELNDGQLVKLEGLDGVIEEMHDLSA
jgi:uncharacterized protein with WD repeat